MEHPFPSYDSPPLNEVSIGLQFQPLERLKIPHFGLFWERIQKQFPNVEHAPPIIGKNSEPSEWLPLPRVWFIDKSDTQLLQLQADRLNFNWRSREGADPYPRFKTIEPQFFDLLNTFGRFLADTDIGVILPTSAELTYINILEQGREWNTAEDFPVVFKDLAWGHEKARFLPYPTKMSWAISFALPNQQGTLSARLKPAIRIADAQEIMQLEMVANYPVQDVSLEMLAPWYELAHEWIVKGFDDLTRPEAQQKFWGRK